MKKSCAMSCPISDQLSLIVQEELELRSAQFHNGIPLGITNLEPHRQKFMICRKTLEIATFPMPPNGWFV